MANEFVPGGIVGNVVDMTSYLRMQELPFVIDKYLKAQQEKAAKEKLDQEKVTDSMHRGTAPGL